MMTEWEKARERMRESLNGPLTTEVDRIVIAKHEAQLALTGHYLPDCVPGKEPTMHGRCYNCGVQVPDDEILE